MRLDVALVALVATAKTTSPCEWSMHGNECQSLDYRVLEEIDPALRLGYLSDRFKLVYDRLNASQTWHDWLVDTVAKMPRSSLDYTFNRVPTVPNKWDSTSVRECLCDCQTRTGGCAALCYCPYVCFDIKTEESISCPEQDDACFYEEGPIRGRGRFLCGRSVGLMTRAWGMMNTLQHRRHL